MASWGALPADALREVFAALPSAGSQGAVRSVCRRWQQVADESSEVWCWVDLRRRQVRPQPQTAAAVMARQLPHLRRLHIEIGALGGVEDPAEAAATVLAAACGQGSGLTDVTVAAAGTLPDRVIRALPGAAAQLTSLAIKPLSAQVAALQWSQLGSRLCQLSSLSLTADFRHAGDPGALAALTGLTRLRLQGHSQQVWSQSVGLAVLACTTGLLRLELAAVRLHLAGLMEPGAAAPAQAVAPMVQAEQAWAGALAAAGWQPPAWLVEPFPDGELGGLAAGMEALPGLAADESDSDESDGDSGSSVSSEAAELAAGSDEEGPPAPHHEDSGSEQGGVGGGSSLWDSEAGYEPPWLDAASDGSDEGDVDSSDGSDEGDVDSSDGSDGSDEGDVDSSDGSDGSEEGDVDGSDGSDLAQPPGLDGGDEEDGDPNPNDFPARLAALAARWSQLEALRLHNADVGYEVLQVIPALTHLTSLHLAPRQSSWNALVFAQGSASLQDFVVGHYDNPSLPPLQPGALRQLTRLRLSGSNYLRQLHSSWCALPNLLSLELESCERLEQLPEELSSLTQLERLSFSHQRLKRFPTQLTGLCQLTRLAVAACSLKDLPPGPYLHRLHELVLFANRLSRVPEALAHPEWRPSSLRRLDLSSNYSHHLSHADVEALCQLSTLQYLDLRRQQYSTADAHPALQLAALGEALPHCEIPAA